MKKFDLQNDPSLAFISAADAAAPDQRQDEPDQSDRQAAGELPTGEELARLKADIPSGYKMNPAYIEVKSKRAQFVFRPSTYQKAVDAAKAEGVSLNEWMHQIIEAATADRGVK